MDGPASHGVAVGLVALTEDALVAKEPVVVAKILAVVRRVDT